MILLIKNSTSFMFHSWIALALNPPLHHFCTRITSRALFIQIVVPFEPKLHGLHVDQFPSYLILATQDSMKCKLNMKIHDKL